MREELIKQAASRYFGIKALLPYQQLVVTNILEAVEDGAEPREQLVILPTGYGKSLCFMLPALLIEGFTLIIYPLLSLVSDQQRRLQDLPITVFRVTGGLKEKEREALFASIEESERGIIITTAESLGSGRLKTLLKRLRISHVVIDEAHVIESWGMSFRPSYLQLSEVISTLGARAVTAFTATAAASTRACIATYLFAGRVPHHIISDTDRPNIHYTVKRSLCIQHDLGSLLEAHHICRPVLVFCTTRLECERRMVYLRCRLAQKEVNAYHAGIETFERKSIESWFYETREGILLATSAFGLGVDKPDIRTVIHTRLPNSIQEFLQESGRAGRDRLPSRSITLVPMDLHLEDKQLQRFIDTDSCRRQALLEGLIEGEHYCHGCDICDGSALDLPEGYQQMVKALRRRGGEYSRKELSDLLAGTPLIRIFKSSYHYEEGCMALSHWDARDIEQAVKEAIRCQLIMVSQTGKLHLRARADGPPAASELSVGHQSSPEATTSHPGRVLSDLYRRWQRGRGR